MYLYAGSVSLEGVDDGHVYLEVWCKEIGRKIGRDLVVDGEKSSRN